MDKQSLIDFLHARNITSPSITTLISDSFVEKHIPRNTLFLQAGRVSDEYFFLASGFMRAYVHDTEGNEVTTHFYNNQQVVFEVSSFFNRSTSKENIQAMEDCMGWCITYEQLNRLFHDLPEFREFGRSILVKGFAALKTRMISMITETAEQRYADLLNSNPEIFQHAPLKYIASYLGITDTSLSRIRKDYAKK